MASIPVVLPSSVLRRLTIAGIASGAVLLVLLIAALLLLAFGWGLLRGVAERRLSAALARPVTVGAVDRIGSVSLRPLLAIRDVRVGQPAWAGSGDMLRLREARVRVAVLPLLFGHARPEVLLVDGVRLALVRDAAGRANWQKDRSNDRTGGAGPDLGRIVIRDAIVSIDDRRDDRRLVARVAADPAGFRLAGRGTIAGAAATLTATGGRLGTDAPWPFSAAVRSAPVAARLTGTMRAPLDFADFTAQATASGRGLRDLDRLIDAGLPPTQPFRLAAVVRHDQDTWELTKLKGMIGRSDLAGALTVRRKEGRTLIKGALASRGFDFDDLSSDAGRARAAAEARRLGPRAIPSTPIDLAKLRGTDGSLKVSVARILSRTPTVFRSVAGTLTLDHGVLTVAPLTAGLVAGRLDGTVVVRHQSGLPLLVADVAMRGSRLEAIFNTHGTVAGPLAGRLRLHGHGETVRTAVARADGRVALVSRDGTVMRRAALFLGADVGRGIFAGTQDRTTLRCLVANFRVAGGVARPDPLVFDTPEVRANGAGTIRLADERIALSLAGAPKRQSILRLNGPVIAGGTLELPTINPPPQTRTAGGVLKMIGKALGGHSAPLARDADCAGLAAHALR